MTGFTISLPIYAYTARREGKFLSGQKNDLLCIYRCYLISGSPGTENDGDSDGHGNGKAIVISNCF